MVGMLPAIQRRPQLWKPLLCAAESLKTSPDYIRRLFEPSFSAMSNNARSAEEDLLYCWEEYLKEMGKTSSTNDNNTNDNDSFTCLRKSTLIKKFFLRAAFFSQGRPKTESRPFSNSRL